MTTPPRAPGEQAGFIAIQDCGHPQPRQMLLPCGACREMYLDRLHKEIAELKIALSLAHTHGQQVGAQGTQALVDASIALQQRYMRTELIFGHESTCGIFDPEIVKAIERGCDCEFMKLHYQWYKSVEAIRALPIARREGQT